MAERCSTEEPMCDDDPITNPAIYTFARLVGSPASDSAAAGRGKTSFVQPLFSTPPPTTTTTTPTNSDDGATRLCDRTAAVAPSQSSELVAMTKHAFATADASSTNQQSCGDQKELHGGEDDALAVDEIDYKNDDRHATKITPTMSVDDCGEKAEIFLETPVAESQCSHRHNQPQDNQTKNSLHEDVIVVVDAAAKAKNIELVMVVEAALPETTAMSSNPKRLSDEFFSADDGSDADNEDDKGSHSETDGANSICMESSNTTSKSTQCEIVQPSNLREDEDSTPLYTVSPSSKGQNAIPNADSEVANQGDELNEYFNHEAHNMDAIERQDIEEENKITGGCLIRCRSTKKSSGPVNICSKNDDPSVMNELVAQSPKVASPSTLPTGSAKIATTPTSSRTKLQRFGMSANATASAKINLSESLEKAVNDVDDDDSVGSLVHETADKVSSIIHNFLKQVVNADSIASSSAVNTATKMSAAVRIRVSQPQQNYDSSFFECYHSNDSYFTDTAHKTETRSDGPTQPDESANVQDKESYMTIGNCVQSDTNNAKELDSNLPDSKNDSSQFAKASSSSNDNQESTSASCSSRSLCNSQISSKNSLPNCSYSNRSAVCQQFFGVAEDNTMDEEISRRPDDDVIIVEEEVVPVNEQNESNPDASDAGPSSADDFQSIALLGLGNDHDYEDDNWADCEEVSEDGEEVCTCRDYSDDEAHMSSEDELPSRDVDLSGYTQLDTISEDILPESSNAGTISDSTPRSSYRKRRMTETKGDSSPHGSSGDSTPGKRKRLIIDSITSPQHPSTPTSSSQTYLQSPSILGSSGSERRTPRSALIPTRDNPPPELSNWLLQFQRWSHAERLLAADRLIEYCEPSQVRHMMKVIEPQFQRDFISLLPKELALQVLSFLDPRDLLRAAQTCRSWRFLCDDNLLWKDKCKQTNIVVEPNTDRPKRGRAGNMPHISSPWKAAYMRQTIIEMNWRSRPIRDPKVLKGHDDHVITCLQFCGNRIVSGSDDNTLKVWSAITGKCLRTLIGHTGGVWSSQMAGNCIISGSTDRTLKVWNAETGNCTHTLYGHTSTVRCMHLHENKVVSGSRDATLRVWDVIQGKCLHILVGHLAAVRCVQYDGKLVVSGAYDYMVKVWNPERQECLHTLQGHTNRVYSLQFDGVHVVSGSLDTSIRVWDAETGSCKQTLMGHQSLTSGMELRQNILVSGNADSTVKVWDITSGQCLQTLSGPNKHQSAVTCLQFSSRFVITSSDDGTVKLWDVRTGEFIRNLVTLDSGGSGGVVWRIRANDTKLICAVGSRNGTEETKLMVLDFDVEGACLKCS